MRRLITSWFGTGLILGRLRGDHNGSGSLTSAFTFPVAYYLGIWAGWPAQILATIVVSAAVIWAARPFVAAEGDVGWITGDEAAGAFVSLIGVNQFPAAVVAWVVFRLADILKRYFPGVGQAENLKGSIGVTADDLVAGLYGLLAGHIVMLWT